MDTNASALIIHDSFVRINKFNTTKTSMTKWSIIAGSLLKSYEAEVKIKLPKVNLTTHIFAPFCVIGQKSNYNVIARFVTGASNKSKFSKQLCLMERHQDIHVID